VKADFSDGKAVLVYRGFLRALLALNPVLVRELINDREERTPGRKL